MKKILSLLILTLFLGNASAVYGADWEHVPAKERPLKVIGRGLLNIVTLPAEFISTAKREKPMHPKAWPVTMIPRGLGNMIVRLASGINDVVILPWISPFVEDISPWTQHFELPDYSWMKE